MSIRFGSVRMGRALHVSRTMVVILLVRVFNVLQASCHCSSVRWLCFNSSMSSFTWFELLSKNLIWKSSIFCFGMGLNIIGGSSDVIIGALAISVFGRIFSCMGR